MIASQAQKVLAGYERIPIRFVEVDLFETIQLAQELNLYAYDAYLVLCAREQKCKLISLDKGLLSAAQKAGVDVVEVEGT